MRFDVGPRVTPPAPLPSDIGAGIPDEHPPVASSSRRPPPGCPMHMSDAPALAPAPPPKAGTSTAKCPIDHAAMQADPNNPLNQIPANLSLKRQPNQTLDLPTDRTTSTIPRPQTQEDDGKVWDYPSPQQFYNALVRKGWETPEDSVEMMVDIHNFLNEEAWQEVMKWERKMPGGEHAMLAKFQGRPGQISPKAQLHLWAGKLFPSKFNTEPPFDRHDWIVTRPILAPDGSVPKGPALQETSTRYVIDYYSGAPDEDGNPVFVLDVRPALDSFESISQRVKMTWDEWKREGAAGQ